MIRMFEKAQSTLERQPKCWLITGAAGFIGSNLVEFLLRLNQKVIGLDNFSTGFWHNLEEVRDSVSNEQWSGFFFHEGDICSLETCKKVCHGVDYVLHHAALGSVPRSIDDPISTNHANISGFLNMLVAARDEGVSSFTYAASSSTYGDHPDLPKIEDKIGKPLSPYAVTKLVNEIYADIFARTYGFKCIGLRYFNVFGPRQNPNGAYAAVVPKWINAMIDMASIVINGDGSTSRDFCYVDNVIQANILAATAQDESKNQVYNVAMNQRTTLTQLVEYIREILKTYAIDYSLLPIYQDFRKGDVQHSQADISKAAQYLGYKPQYPIYLGLEKAMNWYINNMDKHVI